MFTVGADAGERIERFGALRFVESLLHELGVTEDRSQRGPEFVTHIGDKLGLVLARDLQILDGFGKLASARLHLLEQPGVLDRDDGLVGKRCDQIDLLVAEWQYL